MAITFAPEPGSISPPLDLLPKDVIPNAREVYNAQNPPDPLAEFEKVEPAFQDAGGAKQIDLNAREKLGGFKDPLADFQKADPIPGFEKADDLDVKSVEDLDAARDTFRPAEYFSSNPDVANDPKKLAKLIEVYRRRDEEGLIAKRVAEKLVKNTPGTLSDIGGGIKRFGERAVDVVVQPTANVVLGTLTGDLFDDQKRAALFSETRKTIKKGTAEGAAGSESATVGLVDLSRQLAQKVEALPGIEARGGIEGLGITQLGEKYTAPKPKTDQQLLAQLADDASFQKNAADILTGQGEAAKNFGLDKETLAKQGIELDENAIRQLSLVDPVTMVATGGAFKLVGVGGKILGTARTLEGAQQLADKLVKVAKIGAGKGIQGVGKATTFVGERFQGSGRSAALITGIGAASQGAGAIESLAIGAATKAAGPVIRKIGKVTEHAGKAIAGEVPVSANLQKVLDYAVKPVIGGAENVTRGAFQGLVAGSPFALAAQDDETAGALLGAGTALGAAGGAGAGAFRVVKQGASRRYFGENRPVLEDVPSPAYGKDAALDAQHEVNSKKLSAQDASELNNFRETLRQQGGEIYAVDAATFRQKMTEIFPDITPEQLETYANHSAFFDANLGDRKVVYLNSDTTGLQHDAGHIFDAILSPEKRAELRTAVEEAFTPEQRKAFRDTYERRVGNKISDKAAIDEFIAEQFAALFNSVPVTELNAPKSLLNKFIDVVAEGAEALGIDLTAGATTPNLGAPVNIGIRKLFQNAAGDVIRANIEGTPPTNVTPFPSGSTGPSAPGGPPAGVPGPPPANVVPLPSRNIRVGPADVAAFKQSASPDVRAAADARARETGVDYARTEAKKDDGSPTSRVIESISDSMESGRPVVQIEHLGITSASTPEAPLGRTPRRGEQAGGYAALEAAQLDVRQNAPPEIVNQHSKNFVPVRWTDQGGTPTLIAMSLDKVIANMMKVAADPKAKDLIPYPVENGKFTPEGWREVVADAQAYSENQSNGRKGDGGRLEVPEAGLSIPAENPAYTPQPLSPERANFQNLVQGLAPPLTARAQKGTTPGNVKGQILAEANLRPTETPANITPSRAGKQAFVEFPGRTVQEVNPLRNEMERRGVKTRELIEVTERIRAKDIVSAVARPDVNYKAPVTDIIRGGFQPAPTEFRQKNLGGRTVEEFSDYILKASPEEWKAATDNMTGGLTGGAWNLGLGLKEAADVGVLKAFQDKLSDATKAAMKSGDFDGAYSLVSKGQFFREAYEAATGTGSAGAAFKRGQMGTSGVTPPFPTVEKTQATAAAAPDSTTITIGESGAQFLPAEELAIGTAESRPPELRVLPAAPGGRPPTDGPGLRPPPTAAGFQPAEELQTDEAPQVRVLPAAPGGRPPTEPPGLRPPPVASGVARDDESAGFQPKSDEKIQNLAKTYAANAGIEYTPRGGYAEIKPDLSKRLADFYEAAKSNPNDPAVKSSYDALIRETEEQGKSILAAGYKIEPWTGAGEPYKNSAAAISDVRDNKHLFFRQTEGAFAGASDNPMLAESSLVPGQSVNDVFRWVHDFFGHSKEGYQFGPRGEFNAWRAHSEMYSPEAQGALAAETLAQNSWVNFGPQAKDLPLAQRPFAEQKNVVVPKELIDEAGFQPRTESGRKLEERGFEIVPTGEFGIRRVAVTKDGQEVAVIQSVQRSPQRAEISMVQKYAGAPRGVGEVLYREIGSQLRDDGVTSLEGNVVSPEPLAIRRKVFGDFASLDLNGEPATIEQALATAERIQNRTENEVAAIEPVNTISDATRFLPGKKKPVTDDIVEAAIKLKNGRIVGGSNHPDILIRLQKAGSDLSESEFGFKTESGKFLSRDEAREQGLSTGQIEPDLLTSKGGLDSFDFEYARNFLPGRRDAQGRPLKKNGDIDYPKWQKEGAAARRAREAEPIEEPVQRGRISAEAKTPTGWILPDKTFVPLDTAFHEGYLAENAKDLNKRFGTALSETPSVGDRLDALNAGFVRFRYDARSGNLLIEANAGKWPKIKPTVKRRLQDNEDRITGFTLSLLNDKALQVDSVTVPRMQELSGPQKLNAIDEAVDSLRVPAQ